eukprot:SAG11_NODE_1762_length_4300_cov_1.837658_1_plen_158_part_00
MGDPDACCAWCASDPTCVVANFDIADKACWLKVKPYTAKPNPMDKDGVWSLYLCRRGSQDDSSLLQLNAAGGCKPQAHNGWTFVVATLAGVSLYVLIGTAYSVKVKQMPLDVEALPNIALWLHLYGLVLDGVIWTKGTIGNSSKGGSGIEPQLTTSH